MKKLGVSADSESSRARNDSQKHGIRREEQGQVRTVRVRHHNRSDHFTCMLLKDTG